MREKAIQFWSVVKVEQVKLRPQKCSCGTLHFWVAGLQLKDEQLNSKFLKYDLYPSFHLAVRISNMYSISFLFIKFHQVLIQTLIFFFSCECSQIQFLKHLAMLKLLEITILGKILFHLGIEVGSLFSLTSIIHVSIDFGLRFCLFSLPIH